MVEKKTETKAKAVKSPFSEAQLKELKKPLDKDHIKTRPQGGTKVEFIEGAYAINRANEILGYGNWGREIMSGPKLVGEWTLQDGGKTGFKVAYATVIRVTVKGCEPVEDEGFWDSVTWAKTPTAAHNLARKASITDGIKRCLRTLGDQFGNELYDKTGDRKDVDLNEVDVAQIPAEDDGATDPKVTVAETLEDSGLGITKDTPLKELSTQFMASMAKAKVDKAECIKMLQVHQPEATKIAEGLPENLVKLINELEAIANG